MTLHSRAGLFLLSAAILAACGGRSQLRDSSATGAGSGPTTSSAGASSGGGFGGEGGTGGQGGTGGIPGGCVLDGPPIGIAGTEGYTLSNPVLLAPGKSESTTLVAGWTATEGTMIPPTELRHTSFPAWGAWPADGTVGPSYLADYNGGQLFYAAPAASGFSLFYPSPPPAVAMLFVTPLFPGSGALGGAANFGQSTEQPLFMVQGGNPAVQLLGSSSSITAPHVFNAYHVNNQLGTEVQNLTLGCALDPIVAGAAPVGGDLLVAFSSNSVFTDPACSSGGPGTGSLLRLVIARVDQTGHAKPAGTIDIGAGAGYGPIASVKLTPRSDGAWLAWTHQLGQLQVARLDSMGQLVNGPFEIPFFGDPASLSATSLGDRLALAWSASGADTVSQIRLNVLSSAGSIETDVSLDLGPPATRRMAVLASPSSNALLLAWAEEASLGAELRMARFACSLP